MIATTPRARVLIVDDEPTNIRILAAALADHYELRFATDAGRALQLVTETRFDLILLDVVMPVQDGYALLEVLRADPRTRSIPVIFVTSMSESDEEARGLTLGAVDYITKPANPAIVRARVATHIELKQQRDLLERQAYLDGLTGIANRRRFDQAFGVRLASAAQARVHGLLLLIDIDHFKAYNDCYGHLNGDECLRRVATAIQQAAGDALCARYGGEEFVVFAEQIPAQLFVEAMLAAVAGLSIAHSAAGVTGQVSISIGASERLVLAGDTPAQWLAATDALLYRAKDQGRHRGCLMDRHSVMHTIRLGS